MSGKLDQSLDEILSTQRRSARRGRGRGAAAKNTTTRASVAAPAGGVKKTRGAKASKPTKAVTPTGPAVGSGDSKIIVSNLPTDVNEGQIKEYFTTTVGPVKKVLITYGPNGMSRGVATVIFHKADGASKASSQLNGMLVDGRSIKIEVVLDATKARAAVVPVKALSERVSQPKNAPKPATSGAKATTNGTAASVRGGRPARGGRRGRAGRAKPKTADELDAEMADYFDGGNGPATAAATGGEPVANGGPVQANNAGGDAGMEDEIM
ncbi:MAG: hypothetical protein M1817_005580 [Caeruleum heppii]|nr:MAG: hypothetical protein M1817_005580 [Caeruleum heppii]